MPLWMQKRVIMAMEMVRWYFKFRSGSLLVCRSPHCKAVWQADELRPDCRNRCSRKRQFLVPAVRGGTVPPAAERAVLPSRRFRMADFHVLQKAAAFLLPLKSCPIEMPALFLPEHSAVGFQMRQTCGNLALRLGECLGDLGERQGF